jgi:hypothetical protein
MNACTGVLANDRLLLADNVGEHMDGAEVGRAAGRLRPDRQRGDRLVG